MLRIDRLKIPNLPPLTFQVANGECLAIEGPSGSGKTRLMRAIADLDDASGQLFLDGIERAEVTGPAWRQRIRYLAAEPGWWTDTPGDALETLSTSLLHGLCTDLGLHPNLLDRPILELSTGERQRFALIRAIADTPRVLLLDEPTSALDQTSAAKVETLIQGVLQQGRIVLVSSHDGALLDRLAHVRLQLAPQQDQATRTAQSEVVRP